MLFIGHTNDRVSINVDVFKIDKSDTEKVWQKVGFWWSRLWHL